MSVELPRESGGATDAETVAEFTAFYRESAPRLVAFLRWQGASVPDAADCVQEALSQAFVQWSKLNDPYAWCRTVASRGYGRLVSTRREHPTDDLDVGSPLLPRNADLEEIENRRRILALLERLPPRQRQVMAWTFEGATPNEIATALQITPDAVRVNLHKARFALRQLHDKIVD